MINVTCVDLFLLVVELMKGIFKRFEFAEYRLYTMPYIEPLVTSQFLPQIHVFANQLFVQIVENAV